MLLSISLAHQCKLKFGVRCEITSFESFLSCVVTSFSQEQTEGYGHVDKTYRRCGVCDFPYDYVGEITQLILITVNFIFVK